MKAIVLSDNRTPELRDLPDPTPKSGQVLLQVDHCGICGSDLHAATATLGGFAEFAAVDARTLHRLPDEVTGTQGAWVEPASVALRAVRRSEIKVGDRAIVFGAGPIGLLAVMMLRAAGAGHIAVVEPSQARRSKALRSAPTAA